MHTKGASLLTAAALNTIICSHRKTLIMRFHGCRYLIMHRSKVIELINHSDIYTGRAWSPMSAISALS